MPIDQPLVIIIGIIPEKRAVFGCAKVARDCGKSYAGQHERPGYPILAHLAGAQSATEQVKAPVAPPTQRHTLDGQRIGNDMRQATGAKCGDDVVPTPYLHPEQQAKKPNRKVMGDGSMSHMSSNRFVNPFQPIRRCGTEHGQRYQFRPPDSGNTPGNGDMINPLHLQPTSFFPQ
jgi:hypothetical protein